MPRPQPTVSADGNGSGEEDELAEEEGSSNEEYEIEEILEHKTERGKRQYWVKWKGFEEKDNSWVHESDAEGASELIDEYNRKLEQQKSGKRAPSKTSRVSKSQEPGESISGKHSTSTAASKGRGAKKSVPQTESIDVDMEDDEEEAPQTVPVSKTTKRTAGTKRKQPDSETPDRGDYGNAHNMSKYMKLHSWEDVVKHVDTVEQEQDGTSLKVFFVLKDGSRGWNSASVCRQKCPNKLLDFYEKNLKWRS